MPSDRTRPPPSSPPDSRSTRQGHGVVRDEPTVPAPPVLPPRRQNAPTIVIAPLPEQARETSRELARTGHEPTQRVGGGSSSGSGGGREVHAPVTVRLGSGRELATLI